MRVRPARPPGGAPTTREQPGLDDEVDRWPRRSRACSASDRSGSTRRRTRRRGLVETPPAASIGHWLPTFARTAFPGGCEPREDLVAILRHGLLPLHPLSPRIPSSPAPRRLASTAPAVAGERGVALLMRDVEPGLSSCASRPSCLWRGPPELAPGDCLVSPWGVCRGPLGFATPTAIPRVFGSTARIWPCNADAGGGTRTPDTRIMIPLAETARNETPCK